jgi:hypothetical protein
MFFQLQITKKRMLLIYFNIDFVIPQLLIISFEMINNN